MALKGLFFTLAIPKNRRIFRNYEQNGGNLINNIANKNS